MPTQGRGHGTQCDEGRLPMPGYRRIGQVPRKRHIEMPHRPGYKNEGIYYEEVVTLNGFSRAYSIVYHLRPPTRVRRVEPAGTVVIETVDEPALRHHHIKRCAREPTGDPVTGRIPIFTNADVTMLHC